MAERKGFLLRIDEQVLEAMRRWADDDLRSLNGQIEFVLRRALRERGRLNDRSASSTTPTSEGGDAPSDLPPSASSLPDPLREDQRE